MLIAVGCKHTFLFSIYEFGTGRFACLCACMCASNVSALLRSITKIFFDTTYQMISTSSYLGYRVSNFSLKTGCFYSLFGFSLVSSGFAVGHNFFLSVTFWSIM
jgi:hypothetical protein